MPISVGDSRTFYRAVMATSMCDVMETCQRGLMDYTFLGGAQIDAYGNLNSTMIGSDYAKPKVRFPGSGGANDLASFCWRVIVVMYSLSDWKSLSRIFSDGTLSTRAISPKLKSNIRLPTTTSASPTCAAPVPPIFFPWTWMSLTGR